MKAILPHLKKLIRTQCFTSLMLFLFLTNNVLGQITQPIAWTKAYDQATASGTGISFAIANGSNRILVVAITTTFTESGGSGTQNDPSTITYGGVTLTRATGNGATSGRMHTWLYYLKDNAVMDNTSRAFNVTVGSISGSSLANMTVWYSVYAGVDQTSSITTGNGFSNTNGSGPAQLSPAMAVNINEQAVYVSSIYADSRTTSPSYTINSNWTSGGSNTGSSTAGNDCAWKIEVAKRNIPASNTTDNAATSAITPAGQIRYAMSAMSLPMAVPPPTITSYSPTSACYGSPTPVSVVITGTNFTGVTGVQFNGVSATYTVNSATQITATVPATATTGKISVTKPGVTVTSSSDFTVIALTATAGSNSPICKGQTLELNSSATGGTTYTYSWSGPNGFSSNLQNPTIDNAQVAASGPYTVTITGSGCSVSATTNVLITNPVINSVTGNTTICEGSPLVLTVTSTGAIRYTLYDQNLQAKAAGDITSSPQNISVPGLTAGAYDLYVSDECNDSDPFSFTVAVNLKPTATISYNSGNPLCTNGSSSSPVITVLSGGPLSGQSFTSTAGLSINSSTGVINPGSSTTGNYTVTYSFTGLNGCANNATTSVTISAVPVQPGTISGDNTPCQGSAQSYSVTNISGVIYTWSYSGSGASISGQGSNSISISYSASASSGTLSVTPSNGCGTGPARTMNIIIDPLPGAAGSITGTASQCANLPNQVYSISSVAYATSYSWVLPAGWTITAGDGTTSITVTTGTTGQNGSITVTPVNACGNGTSSSKPVEVNRSAPAAAGAPSGDPTVCLGSTNLVYSIAAVPGADTYTWHLPDGWTFTGDGTTSIIATAGPSAQNGNIYVITSNACGSSQSTLNINPVIAQYNTGYVDPSNKNSDLIRVNLDAGANDVERRGYIKFPLSGLPSGAIITGATLSLTNNNSESGSTATNFVTALSNIDPVTASRSTIYDAVETGTTYNSSQWSSTGILSLPLNSSARNDIQSRLSSPGYIAMGLLRGGTNDYYFYGYSGGANAPKLTVTYAISAGLPVTVNAPPNITGDPSGTDRTYCLNQPAVGLSITASAGSGSISGYQWYRNTSPSNSGGTSISGATTSSYTPSTAEAGDWYYYCVVTNSNGCSTASDVSGRYRVYPLISNNTIGVPQTICSGLTPPVTLIGSSPTGGSGNYNYNWESSTTSSTLGFGNASGTRNTQSYTPPVPLTLTTWYRRRVTSGGCEDVSPVIEITVNPLPAAVSVGGAGTFCNSTTITASGGSGGIIYFQGTTSQGTSTATPSSSALVTTSGTYYFRSKSASPSDCWGPQGSVTVTINNSPSTTSATSFYGGNGAPLTASGSCPPLVVTKTTARRSPLTGTSESSPDVNWTNPGYIYYDDDGLASTVNLTNSNNQSEYLWATNFGFDYTVVPSNAEIQGITVYINRWRSGSSDISDRRVRIIKGGNRLTIVDYSSGTAWSTSQSTVATYGGPDDLWGTTWDPVDIWANNFGVALSVEKSSGSGTSTANVDFIQMEITYTTEENGMQWYTAFSGGTLIGSGSPFNPVNVLGSGVTSSSLPGDYTFYAECASVPGCRAQATLTIVCPSSPPQINAGGPTTFCAGGNVVLSTPQYGSFNYQWKRDGIDIPGATTSSYTALSSGSYTVARNVPGNVCSAAVSVPVDVIVNDLPVPTIGGLNVTCQGTEIIYNTESGMPNYLWTISSGGSIVEGGTPADNTVKVAWNTAGSQSVTVNYTDLNGCTAASAAVYPVTVNPLPVATAGSNSPVCQSAVLNLNSGGGSSYSWTGPGGFKSDLQYPFISNVSAAAQGDYFVTVKNTYGCSSTATTPVVVNIPPDTRGTQITYGGSSASLESLSACGYSSSSNIVGRYAGTGATGGGSGIAWSNPTRVVANDNSYTSASLFGWVSGNTDVSETLRATQFNFNIPLDANIDGIQVTIGRLANASNGVQDNSVRLIKNGTAIGPNNRVTTDWSVTETAQSYGSANEMWETSWNPGEINASNFGVELIVNISAPAWTIRTASVDYIQVTIYYTTTIGGTLWYKEATSVLSIHFGNLFDPNTVPASGITNFSVPGTYTFWAACKDVPECRTPAIFEIKKADQTISWANPAKITYGTPLGATQLNAAATGVPGGAAAGPLTYTPALGAQLPVGNHTLHVVAEATNYYNAASMDVTIIVDKAPLVVTANNKSKVYGAEEPILTYTPSGTLFYGDQYSVITGVLLSTATGKDATYGTHIITASGGVANNYVITHVPGTLTVSKAPITVKADDKTKVYGGPDPELTYSVVGNMFYGDTRSVFSGINLSTVTGASATAGPHDINISGGTADNYEITHVKGTLTVSKAPLTVTANDKSKVYGDTDPDLTYTPSGTLFYGDQYSVITGVLLSTATGKDATYGTHIITASGGVADNYVITHVPGTLTVSKAPLTITAENKEKFYGSGDPTFTVTYAGFKYDDNESVVSGLVINRTTGETVGDYTITPSGATAFNYEISFETGILKIKPAPVSTTILVNNTVVQTYVQYSDQVTFTARIIGGAPLIEGGPQAATYVNFMVGAQVMPGGAVPLTVQGSDIYAERTYRLTETSPVGQMAPGVKTVYADFTGFTDINYDVKPNPVSTNTLTITSEDARVEYTGELMKATANASTYSATVTLRANIMDIFEALNTDPAWDNSPGDIRNAYVKFVNRETNSDISGWIPVSTLVEGPSNTRVGTVSFLYNVSGLTATTPYAITSVGIIVGIENNATRGYYYRDNRDDDVMVTVYVPDGDFITGGGYIVPYASAGTYKSDVGKKMNFGFNVKFNPTGKNLKGHMNIIFRRTESDGIVHTYQIKANAMQSLGVNASDPAIQTAEFVSKANFTDVTNPLNSLSLGGNKYLYVKMTDRGEPGNGDQISVVLVDGTADPTVLSNIIYSSHWMNFQTRQLYLRGGNLVVHSGFSITIDGSDPTDTPIAARAAEFGVKAYPNPFSDHVYFDLQLKTDSKVRLELFDISGSKIATIYDDIVVAFDRYRFEYTPENVSSGTLFYRLIIDGKLEFTGTLIHQ